MAPVFPFSFYREGRVYVELIVDTTGRVINPYIVRSTNPWLERPALEAILQWSFEPAVKDGVPVAAKVTQMVEFDPINYAGKFPWHARKARNHDRLPDDLRWDEAPVAAASTFPAYPLEFLQASKGGYAAIRFRINESGVVVAADLVKATAPELGYAALASIDAWRFKPARRKGKPCSALVTMDFDYDPVSGGDVPVSPGMKGMVRELRREHPRFLDVADLDRAPKPLSRRPPVYPCTLRQDGKPGKAVIEYYLDKNGDAQLPHIISASRPEFGYAAAQAVACWRFEPATKNGHEVLARCRVSVDFFAPSGPGATGDDSVIINAQP